MVLIKYANLFVFYSFLFDSVIYLFNIYNFIASKHPARTSFSLFMHY